MLDVEKIRSQFPALSRKVNGLPATYFDGPAGSQVPQSVANAVADYLLYTNANCGAAHATSRETDEMLAHARQAVADFVNAYDSREIAFGPNMTTLTLSLSRALARTWFVGDEIIVSNLDHDANVSPWILAAQEAGVIVKRINVNLADCTLDMHHYRSLLTNRTKLVAVGGASNATGTINPVKEIVALAHSVGALTFVDAVHLAPHRLLDVQNWNCDFLACSAYKFFGPHIGILWGRQQLLENLEPDKLRPAPDSIPGKWMTGTQNHEGIAGTLTAIEYLAAISDLQPDTPLRERLQSAYAFIGEHEMELGQQLMRGLENINGIRVWGITEEANWNSRVPTFSITHRKKSPQLLADELTQRGFFVWAGNHYALPFTEYAGLEPTGTLRIGFLHYNTRTEVEQLLAALESMC